MQKRYVSSNRIKPKQFTEEQLYEIQKGEEHSLPVHLYSNPHFTSREMAAYRNMLETYAASQMYPNHRYVVTDYGPEEVSFGFKSESNYEKYPDRVCYIPENWDFDEDGPGYTAWDILELCNGDKDQADMVFALCDWQHPSTILDEWDDDDSLALVEKKQDKIQKLESEIQCIRSQIQENGMGPLDKRIHAANQRRAAVDQKLKSSKLDLDY